MTFVNFILIFVASTLAHLAQYLDIVTTSLYNTFVMTREEYDTYASEMLGILGEMVDGYGSEDE